MSLLFRLEWLGHLVVLGMVITAIRNRIGWWKTPTYGDDGLLSIESAPKLHGTPYEELPNHWGEIACIVGEFLLYCMLWTWILRLV
jgi:hypothetical protein